MKIIIEEIMHRWQAYYDNNRDEFQMGDTPQEALERLLKKPTICIPQKKEFQLTYNCPVCGKFSKTATEDCTFCGFKNSG